MQEVLTERDAELGELHAVLADAGRGAGGVVLVTGEAGAGKSALIRSFLAHAAGPPFVLRGRCDPLSLPRPLGALLDAVGVVDPALAARLGAGTTRAEAFATAASFVDGSRSDGRTTVFVVEDVHWADDSTLDLLTFLGRRVVDHRTLLVLSFRDDEVGRRHPLQIRLGDMTAAIRCRLRLAPLSATAVATMAAGTALDPDDLHRMTGGNPFFVTEVLAGPAASVPPSVRDAVLARVSRLDDMAREVLQSAAIIPGRVERWLLAALTGDVDADDGLATCVERGLLVDDGSANVTFRHELARLVVLETLVPSVARMLHTRALAALSDPLQGPPDRSRLAFHAAQAGAATAVLDHAPRAAAEAAAIGAHTVALEHLANAMQHRSLLAPLAAAQLTVWFASELSIVGRFDESIAAYDDAAAAFESLGDLGAAADAIAAGARPLISIGRVPEAEARSNAAAALVADLAPRPAAARVATTNAALAMLARRFATAESEGRRAMELAAQSGDDRTLAEASIQSGIALAMSGDDAGLTRIEHGIALAASVDDDALVSLGHSQIGSGYGELRRYDVALPALRRGEAFAEAREIIQSSHYARAWTARCEMETGNWDVATRLAGSLVRDPRCVGISRFVALTTVAWLRGRRGDPDTRVAADEALTLARATGHLQRLWPIAACRAELAWLAGTLGDEIDLVDEVLLLASSLGYARASEELSMWRGLFDGVARGSVDDAVTPFGLFAAGRPDLAASAWDEIGCPYEAAVARWAAGSVDGLRAAHALFDSLGAAPMRTRTAAALKAAGAPVPRGPGAASRTNAAGLTDREVEVLRLLSTGASNRQIAEQLHISAKTAGHHVSHLFGKLDVHTRVQAAQAADRLGLTAK